MSVAAQKAHREAEAHEIKKPQENAATALGLWPHVAKRRAGRFGKAALWVSALYREIEDDRTTADLKRLRPAWSSSDQLLRRTEEDAVTDLRIAPGGPMTGDEEGPVETTEPPDKKRRQHHVVGGGAKDWFMSLRGVHPSWFTAECLRFAQRLAPEIFGPVCVDSMEPRRKRRGSWEATKIGARSGHPFRQCRVEVVQSPRRVSTESEACV